MTPQEQTARLVQEHIQTIVNQGITPRQLCQLRWLCREYAPELRQGVFFSLMLATIGTSLERFSRLFMNLFSAVEGLDGVTGAEMTSNLIACAASVL